MVTELLSDIYAKTNNGLDILLFFYPQARECVEGRAKHFKIRESEQTASACLKEIKGLWKVTDFGDAGRATSPIDICMQEMNMSFTEAVFYLAKEFNVDGRNIHPDINKPEIRSRAASEDEPEGTFTFELNEELSDAELALLGPKVTKHTCKELGYSSVKQYSTTRNGKTTTIISNENYPIFMRKCLYKEGDGKTEAHFYKIYQPLNPDKGFRFFYNGTKPQKYINGLYELEKAYRSYNDRLEKEKTPAEDEEGTTSHKMEKLPEAFICSGERDALCCHALGYYPLWFNSETYNLSEQEWRDITKYVDKVYNIPDIDETGVKRGIELAEKFIDIYLIWLPEKLRTYKDRRGKPRKDFRDFCELWPEKDRFKELLNMAMPFRFWEYRKEGKQTRLEVINEYAMHFLKCNGFHCIEDKSNKKGRIFVHVENNVVREVTAANIRQFLRQFVRSRYLILDIRELVNNTTRLSEIGLENLDEIKLDFTGHTENSQLFFFKNEVWEATATEVIKRAPKEIKHYAWQDEIIDHAVRRLEPAFTINNEPDADGNDQWDIKVSENNGSNFFKYLINASRIFWRKELEKNVGELSEPELFEYRKQHKFDIAGPVLSANEIAEQKQHLVNKIFCLGYLLHRYKSDNRCWCVFAMDNKDGETGESNGGSGKSFFLKSPRFFMKHTSLSGRNPKLTENDHIFENVTEYTKYVFVDDAHEYFNFGFFFDIATGDMPVNPKHTKSFTIPFEKAPKIGITSNYTLKKTDGSSERRILYAVFSDYYHERTRTNDYLQTRTIYDDFGKNLFRENYTDAEWNADLNFFVDCCQFYLSVVEQSKKIQPPMDMVTARSLRAVMTEPFFEWAKVYFSKEGDNCDCLLPRGPMFVDFQQQTNNFKWSAQRFSKALKAFCDYMKDIIALNPPELGLSDDGRIIRKVMNKATEHFYIQTQKEINDYLPGDLPI